MPTSEAHAIPRPAGARSPAALLLVLALACLTLTPPPRPALAAGFELGVKLSYEVGLMPQALAVGDLDGDGVPDLIVSNYSSGTVSVLIGTGSGFGARTDLAATGNPEGLALGDLDGDGTLDLVVLSPHSTTFSVWLGDGAGGFGPRTDRSSGAQASGVAIGDLDQDGRPDVVLTHMYADSISVFRGDGAGGFGARVSHAAGSGPYGVAIADMNDDGVLDVVVANRFSNGISVLLGDGAGGFAPRTEYVSGGSGPLDVAVGDLNGDASPDVAVANFGTSTVSVFLNDGAGGLGSATTHAAGLNPMSVAVGDLDGDGRPDLAVAAYNGCQVRVLLGDGAGGFGAATLVSTATFPAAVAVGDLNGDGRNDLAVASGTNPGSAIAMLARGVGDLRPAVSYPLEGDLSAIAIGDLTGEGVPDLAVARRTGNSVALLSGAGDGTFSLLRQLETGTAPVSVAIGDVDESGEADLVVGNNASNNVSVLLGMGRGEFKDRADYEAGSLPRGVAVGDLDLDGDLDLAVANSGANTISVLLGDGEGAFAGPTYYATGDGPWSVGIGRLTLADTLPDLAVANSGANTVSVLPGNGAGAFGSKTDYATGNHPVSVGITRIAYDFPALVLANAYDTTFSQLHANSGGFSSKLDYAIGDGPRAIAIVDMNGDGWLDVAAANANANTAAIRLAEGIVYGPVATYPVAEGPQAIAAGDLDGDGRPDLAVATSAGEVDVLLAMAGTRTGLASAPNPCGLGAPVTLTATVSALHPASGSPSGTVRFFDGFTLLGTAPLSAGAAELSVPAAHLGNRSLTAVYGGDTRFLGSCSSARIQRVVRAEPHFASLCDVPADEGRHIRGVIARSPLDYPGSPAPILRYDVFRRALTVEVVRAVAVATGGAGWDSVASVAAAGDSSYDVVLPTLADSNATGVNRETYFVRAIGASGVFFDSAPDSGYSVDNLPPAMPAPFTAAYASGATHLHWGPSSEPDFDVYHLHRGDAVEFVPGPSNLIAATADTGFTDAGPAGGYYRLSALDTNGNESAHALVTPAGTTDVAGGVPLAFALEGVRSNPVIGHVLEVRFALATPDAATLELLDVSGRRMAARDAAALGVGHHTVDLLAGQGVPPGVYLVRLAQAGRSRVLRVVVLE